MFLKFSRDDESQSDMLGLRYMTRTGYDPNEMPKMFVTLDRISELQGGGRIPAWASTHPDPDNREQATYERIASLPPEQRSGTVNRDGYLRRLDGVVYGDDPRQGYFIDNAFYHPELEFMLMFPDGWQTMNTRQFVAAVSPEENAIIQLSLAREDSSAGAADAFFAGGGVERGRTWRRDFHHFRTTPSQQRPTVVRGLAGFIQHGGLVYQLVGYTTEERWQGYQGTLERSLATFTRVSEQRYLDVNPATIELVKLPERMTISQFNRRFPSTVDDDRLAILNGVEPNIMLDAGTLVKRVVGGQLPDR
jgi:predicted Zn-dependent protease